jgi:hypothetical protein
LTDHPRDVWVEITTFGDTQPRLLLAVDGRELEIAELRELYAHDRITIQELEQRIAEALT